MLFLQMQPSKAFVSFEFACFQSEVSFQFVKFNGVSSFNKARFVKEASFRNVIFEEAASAWAALIRLMEKIHNMPQRAIFHAKLLEVEKHCKSERSAKVLYDIYEMLGSGRSALLPFIWLLLCSVLSFPGYWLITSNMLSALVYSLGNTIPFIPTHNTFTKDIWNDLSSVDAKVYLTCTRSVHALISILLIALIGLALRNRFRVK